MAAGSSAEPVIRDFDWPDYPAAADLWRAAGRNVLPENELRSTLAHNPGLMLLAEVSEQVAGVVLGTFDGRRGWIHRLAVHPAHRRVGLASALVSELEQRFRDRGAPRINLLVMPDNTDGLAFWQRLGYLPHPDVLCSKPL
jgi:ribosomal protein S18 acetylase RimI-like enzyme